MLCFWLKILWEKFIPACDFSSNAEWNRVSCRQRGELKISVLWKFIFIFQKLVSKNHESSMFIKKNNEICSILFYWEWFRSDNRRVFRKTTFHWSISWRFSLQDLFMIFHYCFYVNWNIRKEKEIIEFSCVFNNWRIVKWNVTDEHVSSMVCSCRLSSSKSLFFLEVRGF